MVIERTLKHVPAQAAIIKTADHILYLGPGGGVWGGEVVTRSTPKGVAEVAESHTGQYLITLQERRPEAAE